jgi:DUF4097 and DUF4098 domain-containing protein YvlB
MRTRSLALPILLIGLGGLFLLNNLLPDFSIWGVLGEWWPLLLIVFGFIRVVEVLIAFNSGAARTTAFGGGRSMGFGWILAIIFLSAAVSIPHHIRNLPWSSLRANGVKIFGDEFDYPVTQTAPQGTTKRFVIDNLRGSITINGADVPDIKVTGQKTIHAFDKKAADAVNAQSSLDLVPEGDALYLRAAQPSNSNQTRSEVSLEITVPRGMSVEARGRSGDLTVDGIAGGVDISSTRGEVRLEDLGGNARLDVEHSDLVRATNVKGTIDIQGKGRDIQLENVSGQVTINGQFSGTLDFKNLAMPLHFESDQTDVKVEKLPGNISMDLGDFRAENLVGPVKLVMHSRDIHLDEFSGPVDIEIGHGDVELKPGKGKLSRMDVKNHEGNVDISLPTDEQFDLKASAQQGDVNNDFGDGLIAEAQGRANSLHSPKDEGPVILLNSDRGEISVRKIE